MITSEQQAAFAADALKIKFLSRPHVSWSPQTPHPKQKLFLDQKGLEVFFGGAAGGAKSSALLMAALQYVDTPKYSAILFRRTYADLALPDALMSRAHEWLSPHKGRRLHWSDKDKTWTFPSGATLTFGYLESENDKFRYQGSAYQFIGFDEVTQFSESQYLYLFSRLRRLAGADVPLRMRSASNPGGVGGRWVHRRFIPENFTPEDAKQIMVFWKEENGTKRAFIPSLLDDNPSLDRDAYAASLEELDPVTREQLLRGDWRITDRGDIYPMWNEQHHVISWSMFQRFYQSEGIPKHWPIAVFMDNGTTEGHPNVTSWFTTVPANAPLSGSVFLFRGHCVYNQTVNQIAQFVLEKSKDERDRVFMWRNGHEGNSERISYNRDFGLPFSPWKADRNRGIAQVRNYLEVRHKDLPHPFKPELAGRPTFYLIVDDGQMDYAKDDHGLARWREEFPAYHYKQLKSGDPSFEVVPYPLFNDAMDTCRAAGAEYFAPLIPLSRSEVVEERVTKVFHGRTFSDMMALPPIQRDGAIHAYHEHRQEIMKAENEKVIVSNIRKYRKNRR